MPPVMGVAAFVLAPQTAVPYREIIIAATLPALVYFFCLFLAVVFQSRTQGIEAIGDVTNDMRLTRNDVIHLLQIFLPILLILSMLLTPKDALGCGWLGGSWARRPPSKPEFAAQPSCRGCGSCSRTRRVTPVRPVGRLRCLSLDCCS